MLTVAGVISLAARHSAQSPPPSPTRYHRKTRKRRSDDEPGDDDDGVRLSLVGGEENDSTEADPQESLEAAA
jgi:hypothetical protein